MKKMLLSEACIVFIIHISINADAIYLVGITMQALSHTACLPLSSFMGMSRNLSDLCQKICRLFTRSYRPVPQRRKSLVEWINFNRLVN